jgi:eukaryotic-like serine/threonine-protein kinase
MAETEFGKYRLIAELGHGGMADVFLAVARGPGGFNKLLVVKRLRASLADDPEFVAMLVDEARLAARLNHPNVVQTNEVGHVGNQYFIAMEYLDGQPLHRITQRAALDKKPLPLGVHLRILADTLAGLHHAHELADYDGSPLGVVHRDVTPQNIFVTYDGQVKIVDFGIAKAAGRSTETSTGVVKGKVGYMPREQALGMPLDRRADIFAVGVMLFEAIAGRRLWKGMPDMAIMQALLAAEIPTLRSAKEDAPDELDRICSKAMAAEPEHRYENAIEFQNDLERYMDGQDRTSNREIGKIISELYEDKRKETKGVIERQLAELRSLTTSGQFEAISIPADAMSGPVSFTPSTPRGSASDTLDISRTGHEGVPNDTTHYTLITSASSKAAAAKRGRTIGLVTAACAVLGSVAWLSSGHVKVVELAPPSEPTTTSGATAAPTRPFVAETITLTLRATPPEARFRIDKGPELENPFIGEFARDDLPHTLWIVAPGHVLEVMPLMFREDQQIMDLSLDPVAEPPTTAVTQPSRPAADVPTAIGKGKGKTRVTDKDTNLWR